jgi:hypothetical protein
LVKFGPNVFSLIVSRAIYMFDPETENFSYLFIYLFIYLFLKKAIYLFFITLLKKIIFHYIAR